MNSSPLPSAPPKKHRNLAQGVVAYISDGIRDGSLNTGDKLRARLNSARLAQDDPAVYLERVLNEHEDIYNAIARKDPESARAAMRTHLSNSRERLRRAQDLIEGPAQ